MLEDKIKIYDKLIQERNSIYENLERISKMRRDLDILASDYGIKIDKLKKEIEELKQNEVSEK